MAHNPNKETTPWSGLDDLATLVIERWQSDEDAHWPDYYQLIERMLSRDQDVALCGVEIDSQTIHVILTGREYTMDEYEAIDARLREIIGRVACFEFRT